MTRSLMIQGTCSNAGKSIITAGLCRIFREDGHRVAPFKSQNMSLNSYVTDNNLEMGRAQAVQAFAAGIIPDVRMNPILIKPTSHTGSQIVLMGKPAGNMGARTYYSRKNEMVPVIQKAYRELAHEYDIIVLEGAGSPAEINLRDNDIVNMYSAKMAEAPVIIVGDIDRGGVFASLVGTMELLDQSERDMTAGFIINKFRGDARLLEPGPRLLEERTGKKVFGIMPMISDLLIPDEDSVTFKESLPIIRATPDELTIAIIGLPYISNATDIDPLKSETGVVLNLATGPGDLDNADIIIIPGSKNVIHDLAFLRENGLDKKIMERAKAGTMIIGICGGYQMLGSAIQDPDSIESDSGSCRGLGLLDLSTTMMPEKKLTRIKARCADGPDIEGYEIHHGKSDTTEIPYIIGPDNEILGCRNSDGTVWGTYIHGIFDTDAFRHMLLGNVRSSRGLSPLKGKAGTRIDREFSRLARIMREHLDIESIYHLMEL